MATSAFRSTTRRGSGNDTNGVPDTPRSKRDPSPSGRGFHRRSSSMTDFSARYLSDCSSTSEYRPSRRKSSDIHGGRRSVCPSDSENERGFSSVRRSRRWTAESEDERTLKPSNTGAKAPETEQKTLRRSSSSRDMSQYGSNSELSVTVPDRKPETADSDDFVEEKTIKAVFDQMKQSMQLEHPVADAGMTNFLDSMRAEVRRAVSDIRMELEEALQRNISGAAISDEGNSREAGGPVVIRSVADIQNDYTTKLEESEKKVRELWSQIAVEERRCLELSKIVNELLPTTPPVCLESSAPQVISSGRRPPRRRNSAERQLVLESLDVEAQKYLEECASISSFDNNGDSDESTPARENASTSRAFLANAETAVEPAVGCPSANGSIHTKDLLVGSDGVVLPWLKWEAEAGGSDKGTKLGTKKHTSPRASNGRGSLNRMGGSNDKFYRSGAKSSGGRRSGGASPLLETDKLTSLASIPLFTIDDQVVKVDQPLDVDKFLIDKIQLQCRVNNGELLLCQSCFLI